jgi:3-hydroxyisobutyrate dehydrogenase-like beta-hydroxyacid dehydrogenase
MKIGFIGTGIMGFPMAKRLLEANHELYLYNRTKDKAQPLLNSGASWCESPAILAKNCELVFSMVSNDVAVDEISDEILNNLPADGIHVDCSTVSGILTSRLEQKYAWMNRVFWEVIRRLKPVRCFFLSAEIKQLLKKSHLY